MAERRSRRMRMSDGRQLALLLLGGLLLTGVGVGAAVLFPEPCEDFEGIGTLELRFTDAAAVLPLSAADAAAVEGLGAQLGIGPWRGAVALPPDVRLLPSDFGFFAVTDTDLVALRPGTGVASAPREITGLDAVSVSGTSVALVSEEGRVVVLASDYERERCGAVPTDADVLAIDRGLAVLRVGDEVVVGTLSGGEVTRLAQPRPVAAALLTDDVLAVATDRSLLTARLPDDTSFDVVADLGAVLDVAGERLVATPAGEPRVVLDRRLGGFGVAGGAVTTTGTDAPVLDGVGTPAGTVVLTEEGLETDRQRAEALPGRLRPVSLHASADGQVGLLVAGPDGPVLLVWGRDVVDVP